MESLKQRIESLKQNAGNLQTLSDDKFVLPFIAYDLAIDKVIAILDEVMAEKDSPDSEGWWWNNALGGWRACQVYKGSGINGEDWDYAVWADKKGAKWIKAIFLEGKRMT